jgi:hypothetical protein
MPSIRDALGSCGANASTLTSDRSAASNCRASHSLRALASKRLATGESGVPAKVWAEFASAPDFTSSQGQCPKRDSLRQARTSCKPNRGRA